MWFGVIQVAGFAVGWAIWFWWLGSLFSTPARLGLGPTSTPAQVRAALDPFLRNVATLASVGVVVGFVSLGILTLALRELARVDRNRFGLPSTLMVVMIVGVAIVAVSFIPFLNAILNAVAQLPASPGSGFNPAFATQFAAIFLPLIFVAAGAIITIVGLIGGMILGLWRVGTRYDQTVIKLGAIFTVIPLLNIAAPVLVLVGAHEARNRLG